MDWKGVVKGYSYAQRVRDEYEQVDFGSTKTLRVYPSLSSIIQWNYSVSGLSYTLNVCGI